jgi:hypothetical protein
MVEVEANDSQQLVVQQTNGLLTTLAKSTGVMPLLARTAVQAWRDF